MGGWKLEVGKMAVYLAFPVAIFHFFNQPQYFEEWVTKVKRETFPPENPEHRRMWEETISQLNKQHEIKLMKALEEKNLQS